jgi:hypothetical protein
MKYDRITPLNPLHPINGTRAFRLSEDTNDAINDLMQACFEFTVAEEKQDVEDKYVCMQQRRMELIERISPLEVSARIARTLIVRF